MVDFLRKLLGVFCVVMGVGFLISAMFTFKDCREFKSTSQETTATVTKVDAIKKTKTVYRNEKTRQREVTVYNTYFEYEANGDVYDGVMELSDCIQNGDTFTVWYDKNNPGDVRNDNASYGRVVFVSLGGLLLLFCGGIMLPKER